MSRPPRNFSGKPPRDDAADHRAPLTAAGDKRSFDARPKPSGAERRDGISRPSHHVDKGPLDGLDPDGSEE